MKNGSLFHVNVPVGNPVSENHDHLYIAKQIFEQPVFQDYIYWEGENTRNTGIAPLSAEGRSNFFRRWIFRNLKAPAAARKAGISTLISFGDAPLSSPNLSQLIFSNKRIAGRANLRCRFFSPIPSVAEATQGAYIPGFPHSGARILSWEEKEPIKAGLSGGKEYFLSCLDYHDRQTVVELLKAFTLFKQRQRTSLVWVLAGSPETIKHLSPLLSTYKWKNEIIVTPRPEPAAWLDWLGACYAFVHIPYFRGWELPVHDALACGVPCIVPQDLHYLAGPEGALYTPKDSAAIAERLKLIFKDEGLRSRLVQHSQTASRAYSPEQSALLLSEAAC